MGPDVPASRPFYFTPSSGAVSGPGFGKLSGVAPAFSGGRTA